MAVETKESAQRRPPKIANNIAALLLRSPLHRMLSNFLILLTFLGRKSGKKYVIPVGYGRKEDTLALFTDHSWYKNLQANPKVQVRLQGKDRSGTAQVILDDKERTAREMGDFVRQSKGAARAYNVTFDATESPIRNHCEKLLKLGYLYWSTLNKVKFVGNRCTYFS